MENAKACRRQCLLENRSLIVAINLFLKELDEDFYRLGLQPCGSCRQMYASEGSENIHERLREIFDAILRLRDHLLDQRGRVDLKRD